MEAQASSSVDVWTPEREELVRQYVRTACPEAMDVEVAMFLEQARRSGLDPIQKQCFAVARRYNAGSKERPAWRTRVEFQPAETGMLARAERFPDYLGTQCSAVFAGDSITMDMGAGTVSHAFSPVKRSGALVGAWARVVRSGGKVAVLVWLDFEGYAQSTPLWAKVPTTMIEKCARVAALRKAYPETFGGLYTADEMPAEEQPTDKSQPRHLKAVGAPEGEAQGERRAPREVAARAAAEAAPADVLSMADAALEAEAARLEAALQKNPKARNAPAAMARLTELREERGKRQQHRPQAREPGAEG